MSQRKCLLLHNADDEIAQEQQHPGSASSVAKTSFSINIRTSININQHQQSNIDMGHVSLEIKSSASAEWIVVSGCGRVFGFVFVFQSEPVFMFQIEPSALEGLAQKVMVQSDS